MSKLLSIAVAATIAILSSGLAPVAASTAEAKTANQVKNENKAKAAKAKTASKSAARKSKK